MISTEPKHYWRVRRQHVRQETLQPNSTHRWLRRPSARSRRYLVPELAWSSSAWTWSHRTCISRM